MTTEKPEGIVITFPVQFLLDLCVGKDRNIYTEVGTSGTFTYSPRNRDQRILFGFKECIRQIEEVMASEDQVWYHSSGNKPQHDILYAYISILNKIRYRATIMQWLQGGEMTFGDGRKMYAKHWVELCAFIPAPEEIPFKGCQGFRYCKMLF